MGHARACRNIFYEHFSFVLCVHVGAGPISISLFINVSVYFCICICMYIMFPYAFFAHPQRVAFCRLRPSLAHFSRLPLARHWNIHSTYIKCRYIYSIYTCMENGFPPHFPWKIWIQMDIQTVCMSTFAVQSIYIYIYPSMQASNKIVHWGVRAKETRRGGAWKYYPKWNWLVLLCYLRRYEHIVYIKRYLYVMLAIFVWIFQWLWDFRE